MKKGLVSIITPIFNSEKFIKETYKSILNQTYSSWEWIVIDDNSSDKSLDIVKELSKNDFRIILIKNQENLKAAKSRNKGLNIAKGEYITFIDSDDLWDKFFLEKQLQKMKEFEQNIIFSSYRRVDEEGKESYGEYIVPLKITINDLLKTNHMSCLTVVYKKFFFEELRFNEELKMHEDYVMWLEILKSEKIIYTNQEVLATYRIRKKSVSSNKFKNLKYLIYIYIKVYKFSVFKILYLIICYIYFGIKKHSYKK